MRSQFVAISTALLLMGCPSSSETETTEAAGDEAAVEGTEAEAPAAEATEEPAGVEAGEVAADMFEAGVYTSQRFNITFKVPETWTIATSADGGPAGLGTSDDSVTMVGPGDAGLRIVIANTESIQLADASFGSLTESIGFENVRIHPDRAQTRSFNGVPGYRTEADALLRGDAVPVYIIAQAMELPGKPTMVTIFVQGDQYDIHDDTMFAILDSIEALNLRGQ
ncbi:MAG: hypothetical protein ACI81R_002656 [Bradymonadia bacterium]|jgi:hypothetical protein